MNLVFTSDHGIELTFPCQCREIPAILLQGRGFAFPLTPSSKIFLVKISILSDGLKCFHVNLLQIYVHGVQQTYCHVFPLFDEGQQQMLRTRFLLSKSACLRMCLFEDSLRPGRISLPIFHGRPIFKGDQLLDHIDQLFLIRAILHENFRSHAGSFLQKSDQNVLRPDISLF